MSFIYQTTGVQHRLNYFVNNILYYEYLALPKALCDLSQWRVNAVLAFKLSFKHWIEFHSATKINFVILKSNPYQGIAKGWEFVYSAEMGQLSEQVLYFLPK